jgi:hypothetical protein
VIRLDKTRALGRHNNSSPKKCRIALQVPAPLKGRSPCPSELAVKGGSISHREVTDTALARTWGCSPSSRRRWPASVHGSAFRALGPSSLKARACPVMYAAAGSNARKRTSPATSSALPYRANQQEKRQPRRRACTVWDGKAPLARSRTQWHSAQDLRLDLCAQLRGHVRRNEARCHGVAGDVAGGVLAGHTLSEPNHPSLRMQSVRGVAA